MASFLRQAFPFSGWIQGSFLGLIKGIWGSWNLFLTSTHMRLRDCNPCFVRTRLRAITKSSKSPQSPFDSLNRFQAALRMLPGQKQARSGS